MLSWPIMESTVSINTTRWMSQTKPSFKKSWNSKDDIVKKCNEEDVGADIRHIWAIGKDQGGRHTKKVELTKQAVMI